MIGVIQIAGLEWKCLPIAVILKLFKKSFHDSTSSIFYEIDQLYILFINKPTNLILSLKCTNFYILEMLITLYEKVYLEPFDTVRIVDISEVGLYLIWYTIVFVGIYCMKNEHGISTT